MALCLFVILAIVVYKCFRYHTYLTKTISYFILLMFHVIIYL